MRVVIFCHSLISDWNHGNAHFLRGVIAELLSISIEVQVYEPKDAWSYTNMLLDGGERAIAEFQAAYPGLHSSTYSLQDFDPGELLKGADLVLVHEWNEPKIVAAIGEHRRRDGEYRLLFHDTHHRSVTDPEAMSRYDLSNYDGVLAFGESVAEQYRMREWARQVWVWHEAADTRVFHPIAGCPKEGDLVWVGNWGDEERSAELREYLIEPVKRLGLRAQVYGVRYPSSALKELEAAGIQFGGWLPNYKAPAVFARYRVTVHVPRRPYSQALPGVPTIRVFEALACGIPLVSAPWEDSEGLFRGGTDFLLARDGAEMTELLGEVLGDSKRASELSRHGLDTILERHTCAHRVTQLLDIYGELLSGSEEETTIPIQEFLEI